MNTVAIIGAGAGGVLTAAQLTRQAKRPLRIVLIERSSVVGRGVAYGTHCAAHLLNVPAGRMSALPDDPEHFLRWLQHREPDATAVDFARRDRYGEYLADVLRDSQALNREVRIDRVIAEARDVAPVELSRGASVFLSIGERVWADAVVLAIGNFPPVDVSLRSGNWNEIAGYIANPWMPGAMQGVGEQDRIIIIGTGLTMVDVVLELRDQGHIGEITAISRHGFLPRSHARPDEAGAAWAGDFGDMAGSPMSLRSVLRRVRGAVAAARRNGVDWRRVIDALRPVTAACWQGLSQDDRARFFRCLRAYWDVHRHRIAPQISDRLRELLAADALNIVAGRIIGVAQRGELAECTVRPSGEHQPQTLTANWVINCTGPSSDFSRIDDPLIVQLRERGDIVPDALRLGLETNEHGGLIDSRGRGSSWLYTLGSARKAGLWESIAIPELRVQAASLAAHLLGRLPADEPLADPDRTHRAEV